MEGTKTGLKTCVLFMAHRMNASIAKEFHNLKLCRHPHLEVRLFYDLGALTIWDRILWKRQNIDPGDVTFFRPEAMRGQYNLMKVKRGLMYGNTIFPVLDFALAHDYDFVWKVEFDVRFSGDWQDFFGAFERCDADLLGTALCSYSACPDWSWWRTMKNCGAEVPVEQRLRGFFPVIRLSRKACGILSQAYRDHWTGHYECVVPTVLRLNQSSIEDIGGDGPFTPRERKNCYYKNTPEDLNLWPGTFVWRIPGDHPRRMPVQPRHLYHPVAYTNLIRKMCRRLRGKNEIFFQEQLDSFD